MFFLQNIQTNRTSLNWLFINALYESFPFQKINIFFFLVTYIVYNLLYDIFYEYSHLDLKGYWLLYQVKLLFCFLQFLLIYNYLTEFHFFFFKIVNWNLPGFACKEFILNHVNKIFISCYRFSNIIVSKIANLTFLSKHKNIINKDIK